MSLKEQNTHYEHLAMLGQAPSHTSQNLRAANFRGHVSSSEEEQIKDSFEN